MLFCTLCIISEKSTGPSSTFKLQALCYYITLQGHREHPSLAPWTGTCFSHSLAYISYTGISATCLIGRAQKGWLCGWAHMWPQTPPALQHHLCFVGIQSHQSWHLPAELNPWWALLVCLEQGRGGQPLCFELTRIKYAVSYIQPSQ